MNAYFLSIFGLLGVFLIYLGLRNPKGVTKKIKINLQDFAESHWLKEEIAARAAGIVEQESIEGLKREEAGPIKETGDAIDLEATKKDTPLTKEPVLLSKKDSFSSWLEKQKNKTVIELVNNRIIPNRAILEEQKAFEPIIYLLEMLIEHGECPSMVTRYKDSEAEGLKDFWDVYARTTLLDHTLRVVEKLMEIYDQKYERAFQLGAYLLSSLGHDIGKMPHLRKETSYSMGDHPHISAEFIAKIASEVSYIEEVTNAIKYHHKRYQKDTLTIHLQEADKKAREEELRVFRQNEGKKTPNATTNGNSQEQDWLKTHLNEIMKKLLPHVNETKGFGKWRAFSMSDGMSYFEPDLMWEIAKELAEGKGITDLDFLDSNRKAEGLTRMANELRKRGWLGEGIKEGYYGAYWIYWLGDRSRKAYWTCVDTIEAFGVMPSELEQKKKHPIKLIQKVELSREVKG